MFQSFDATTRPEQGPPRLTLLREEMAKDGLDGFLVPRADRHQGEYVAACDERLAWLTGFTGSAGFAAVMKDRAGVFVDGRYRVQVKAQVATEVFTPVAWPATKLGPWLKEALPTGGKVGFDPWLHTRAEIDAVHAAAGDLVHLSPHGNLIDRIWEDRPPRPAEPVRPYPKDYAGKGDETKRAEIAALLRAAGHRAAVLTLPDSISWLLNIRGGDIPRIPVVHAFAILHDDGKMQLFSDVGKFAHLGPDPGIDLQPWEAFEAALATLTGPVRVDRGSAPFAVGAALEAAHVEVSWDDDPCLLPKACKTEAEIAATAEAHLRDGAAMAAFLAWLDGAADSGSLTEIDVVRALEACRRRAGQLLDISFETIAGAGPNGAIVHYRVTETPTGPSRPASFC
jgi:Xaa-Pro aminopeptidase